MTPKSRTLDFLGPGKILVGYKPWGCNGVY